MILGSPTLKVSVRHKFISLILCKKSGIGYDRSKINFYKKVYLFANLRCIYFSCAGQEKYMTVLAKRYTFLLIIRKKRKRRTASSLIMWICTAVTNRAGPMV